MEKKVCSVCGKEITDDDYIEVDGELVCSDCMEGYARCVCCDEYHLIDELVTNANGDFVCSSCLDRHYYRCDHCGEYYRGQPYTTAHNGDELCESCCDRYYFTCEDCGEVYHENELEIIDDTYYCSSCAENHQHSDGVYEYHGFSESDYSPRRDGAEDEKLYFGVELEADGGSFCSEDFDKWTSDDYLVHFEEDGSLSSKGVECISQPCTLAFHHSLGWDKICRRLSDQGFSSHNTGCCGLHVHITRRALSILQIVKMDVWLNRWLLWRDIARRDSIYSGSYNNAARVDITHAVSGAAPGTVPEKLRKYEKWQSHSDRYQPLNTTNKKTVEVRIFRGTLNSETLLGTIEALHAMVKFAAATPIKRVYDKRLPLEFVKYMAEHKDLYPNVFPMLKRLTNRRSVVGREPAELLGVIIKNAGTEPDGVGEC